MLLAVNSPEHEPHVGQPPCSISSFRACVLAGALVERSFFTAVVVQFTAGGEEKEAFR